MILIKRSIENIKESKWFNIQKTLHSFILQDGSTYNNERDFIKTGNSVSCFIRCKKEEKCLLIKQFRPSLTINLGIDSSWILENVAGMKEENESIEECSIREIQEETGLVVYKNQISNIQKIAVSPGLISEISYIVTVDVEETQELHVSGLEKESEKTYPQWYSYNDVKKLISQGLIIDAKTLIGVYRI